MPAFEVIKTKLSVQRNFEHSLLPTEERESGVAEYPEVVGCVFFLLLISRTRLD